MKGIVGEGMAITARVLFITLLYLGGGAYSAAKSDGIELQAPSIEPDLVASTISLQTMPPPSTSGYDGVGNPVVVITHVSESGGLHRVLHEAEVWSNTPGGVDLCNDHLFRFNSFYVVVPTGGASPSDSNVTYVSDTYGSPVSYAPGGEQCALRVSPGKSWSYRVCMEFDGVLEPPSSVAFDDWDLCVEGDSVDSSSPVVLALHGFK